MNNYYVYQLIDPRNSQPFYIGEGKGNRAYSHLTFTSGCNNPHKDRIIQKIKNAGLDIIVMIVKDNLSKDESRHFEELLIAEIGIDNLSNICPSSHPPILVGADNGFYGKTHTDENKKKCGDSNRGRNTKTENGSRAISESMKARWADPIYREAQITALKNRRGEKRSPEAIEACKRGAAKRDANMTPAERSARTLAGVATKKIKYANFNRQAYIDDNGNKRFRWIPKIL